MTTPLTKRVKRITVESHRNGGKARRLVVTLHPGDTISIREQGRRTGEEFISIASVYQYATRCRVAVTRMEKAKAKIKRKKGR